MVDLRPIAALFVRADSIYKTMPGVDAWDMERDARKWPGGCPVVAHPPCRRWGSMSHMAKRATPEAVTEEMDLARFAVRMVRQWGGVLEHPASSRLWPDQQLPALGTADSWGGYTVVVDQDWWGHRCEKRTRLYIVGCHPGGIPPLPFRLEEPTHVIKQNRDPRPGMTGLVTKGHPAWRPRVSDAEREMTPPAFAEWLVEIARNSRIPDAPRAAA